MRKKLKEKEIKDVTNDIIENKERDKRKMRLKWNGEVEHTNLKTLLSIKPKLSNYWGRSVRIILKILL